MDFGAIYLFILLAKLLYTLIGFELIGISDSDLFVNLNLIVLFKMDLAPNLFVFDCSFPVIVSSSTLLAPCILFLYSPRT